MAFKCTSNENQRIPAALIATVGPGYEAICSKGDSYAKLALALAIAHERQLVTLPFCNTQEAQGLGAVVSLDPERGNRVVKQPDLSSLLSGASFDEVANRFSQTVRQSASLEAVTLLTQAGRIVAYTLTGPVTLATLLMETAAFIRLYRKEASKFQQYMAVLEQYLIDTGLKAVEAGARVISLADPSATVDILGPHFFKEVTAPSVLRVIEGITAQAKAPSLVIHLCGKLSTDLETAGFALPCHMTVQTLSAAVRQETEAKLDTHDLNLIDLLLHHKGVTITGHWCLSLNGSRQPVVLRLTKTVL